MGGWTSVSFVYPLCDQPLITSNQLADFIDRFLSLGVTSDQHRYHSLRVIFGRSIDQDRKPIEWYVPDKRMPLILRSESQELDIEERGNPLDFRGILATHRRPIYRGGAWLGCIREGATKEIDDRIGDGYMPARLYDWSLSIEPLSIESPVSGKVITIGWIALSLGGQGYLTNNLNFNDLVTLVRELPECQRVEELVRAFWPVPPRSPSRKIRKIRREMGRYWTGVSEDEPADWFWIFNGSY